MFTTTPPTSPVHSVSFPFYFTVHTKIKSPRLPHMLLHTRRRELFKLARGATPCTTRLRLYYAVIPYLHTLHIWNDM
ncbi:hypothetical protein [Paenibacillus campi]|uniref:hypothetical protein n=1 Tax=Paenibacillus campi TaxID=3106031 RepID=UPI002AFF9B17|nr:hypothetical protein [Paenibacillus sp. SGZ-1014]